MIPHDALIGFYRVLLFTCAFPGPDRGAEQAWQWQQKIKALTHLAQTGEIRPCERVLADIRSRVEMDEGNLRLWTKQQMELEDGLRTWRNIRDGAREPKHRKSAQRDIDATMNILKDHTKFRVIPAQRLLQKRRSEERAFVLVYRTIQFGRRVLIRP